MLFNYQLWAIVVATLIITCLVIRLKKTCHHNKYKLLGLCMEAASIEIAQRLMMQTFVIKNGTQEYAVRHKKNQND